MRGGPLPAGSVAPILGGVPLLFAAFAAWLTVAGPAPSVPTCAAGPPPPMASLGDGPLVVEAYVDPVETGTLLTVLQLRRFVAERPGTVRVDLRGVAALGASSPRADLARAWVVAMGTRGRLLPALRMLDRDGADRVYVRLQREEDRVALAAEIGLDPEAHETAWQTRCIRRWPDRDQSRLQRRLTERGNTGYRLPLFVVEGEIFEDGANLDKLRPYLGQHDVLARRQELRPRPPVPETRASSERLRRPALLGAVLGGRGLPHLFVLMARAEDDPNLATLLPPVLEYRHQRPGRIAVQIVARGASVGAMRLRIRLCAATRTGLVAAYARYLATDPALRLADPAADALVAGLDQAIPEEECEDEPDPAQMGLPDGGWLDGIPRTQSELENLALTLDMLEATQRPLSPLLAPRPAPPDTESEP
jgi:hypothetical protein